MDAAVLVGPELIEVGTVDEPSLPDGHALVRIRSVGICGTDSKIFTGRIPVSYPRIMGHEMVGTVVETAGAAPPAGSRVVVDPNVACGRCDLCRSSRANLCSNGWLMGRDRDGALCELVAAPPDNIYPVPEAVDDDTAPLIQVLTTCVHSQRRIGIFPGDSVAVVGLGVTGLLQVQLARTRGAWPVIGITRSASKRELAERLGADMTFDAEDGNVVNLVREATGGTGPDVVIESAGTTQTLARSIELVRTGGRVLSYGTITQQQGALPFYQLYYKELDIVGARAAQAEDYPVAIGAVGSGRIRLPELVTHRFELPEADQAMRMSGSGGSLKVVVRVGD